MEDIHKPERTRGEPQISLHASKKNLAIGWATSALVIAFWLSDFSRHPLVAVLAIFSSSLIFTAVPLCFITRTPRLDIMQTGLALTTFSQTRSVNWDEIQEIRIGWVNAGNANWAMNKSLFVKYSRDGREALLAIRPIFFGTNAQTIADHIIARCENRRDLIQVMLQDVEKGALL
jgi:hypothetical protein